MTKSRLQKVPRRRKCPGCSRLSLKCKKTKNGWLRYECKKCGYVKLENIKSSKQYGYELE